MKRTLLILAPLLLALPLMFTGAARSAPVGDPCCNIIAINAKTGIVTARDIKTGRTFQFKADALDIGSLKVGDAVDADILSGKLKSIKGALRTYDVIEPDTLNPPNGIVSLSPPNDIVSASPPSNIVSTSPPNDIVSTNPPSVMTPPSGIVSTTPPSVMTPPTNIVSTTPPSNIVSANPPHGIVSITPPHGIVSIQVDPVSPVNEIVTVRNNATGKTFQFLSSLSPPNGFKVGQAVSLDTTGSWAFVQSSATSGPRARPATYSYPVKGAAENIDTSGVLEAAAKRWVFSPGLKPSSIGRVVVQVFDKARNAFTTRIFNPAEKTGQLAGSFQGGAFDLMPGEYDVMLSGARVTGVPVQRGMDTRILAGMLNVTVDTTWNLYDETKTTKVNGGHRGKKLALPVGKYYIRVGGRLAEVIIKDGQVTDF